MRSVAKWGLFAVLTSAPGYFLFFLDYNFYGRKVGSRVGSIAKWLGFGSPALTPIICTGFHIHDIGSSLWNDDRVGHVFLLYLTKKWGVMKKFGSYRIDGSSLFHVSL